VPFGYDPNAYAPCASVADKEPLGPPRFLSYRRRSIMNENEERRLEERIRERAYKIWLDEGQPEGRDKEHWELAEFAIAQQDGLATTLLPPVSRQPEPIEAIVNQGEFPTLVDQGEVETPGARR
jgi:hypothetical protein